MSDSKSVVPCEEIGERIFVLRGLRAILDSDLAKLYGVPTKRLREQVKRNAERFPGDFAFLLSPQELAALRSQNATSRGHGGARYPPMAFTEHGALMAANVLHSPTAVTMSIFVVRAFVRIRRAFVDHEELARKLEALERRYDERFKAVFDAIRALMVEPKPPRRQIGFHADPDRGKG